MKSYKPVKIIADPWTLLLGVICIAVFLVSSIVVVLDLLLTGDRQGAYDATMILGVLNLAFILICLFSTPRWFNIISFHPEGITIKPALRRASERPYKYYQYVYKGSYWHGSPIGIGKEIPYIIISHRRLRDEELYAVNQLATGADVIKIHYSPQIYQKLMDILPREMQYKLRVCRFEPAK